VFLAIKSAYIDKNITRFMFVTKPKFVLSETETDFNIYRVAQKNVYTIYSSISLE